MLRSKFVTAVLLGGVVAAVAALGGCGQFSPPYMKPLSARTAMLLGTKGMTEQQPILKQKVNQWLRQRAEVLAFCSAPRFDGGTGAVYVLLSRKGGVEGY